MKRKKVFQKSLIPAVIFQAFELAKGAAEKSLGKARAGLMLGIAELGQHKEGFIGAIMRLIQT